MAAISESTVAYIGLGSNLGDRVAHLLSAVNAIKHLSDSIAVSSVYESEPFGVGDDCQPRYLNMVISIHTGLGPYRLLTELLKIEKANGRVRHHRNESRTLDLDLLLFGGDIIETVELLVPHPRMHERAFVMLPMSEIAPDLTHPVKNLTMSEIAATLPDQGVQRLGTYDSLPLDDPRGNMESSPFLRSKRGN